MLILAIDVRLARVRSLLLRCRAERRHRVRTYAFWEESRDRAANGSIGRRPEHAFGRAVDQRDLAGGIEEHDSIHRRTNDLTKASFRLQELAHVAQLELLALDVVNALFLFGDPSPLHVQIDEDLNLRSKNFWLKRLRDVVDRANRVSFENVVLVLADGREKDDRHVLRAIARLDHARGLEAVNARHLHIEQDDGEFALEETAQR